MHKPVDIGTVGVQIMKKTLALTAAELTARAIIRIIEPSLLNEFQTNPDPYFLKNLLDTPEDELHQACQLVSKHLFTLIRDY